MDGKGAACLALVDCPLCGDEAVFRVGVRWYDICLLLHYHAGPEGDVNVCARAVYKPIICDLPACKFHGGQLPDE